MSRYKLANFKNLRGFGFEPSFLMNGLNDCDIDNFLVLENVSHLYLLTHKYRHLENLARFPKLECVALYRPVCDLQLTALCMSNAGSRSGGNFKIIIAEPGEGETYSWPFWSSRCFVRSFSDCSACTEQGFLPVDSFRNHWCETSQMDTWKECRARLGF